jgi:hypothetical protein
MSHTPIFFVIQSGLKFAEILTNEHESGVSDSGQIQAGVQVRLVCHVIFNSYDISSDTSHSSSALRRTPLIRIRPSALSEILLILFHPSPSLGHH